MWPRASLARTVASLARSVSESSSTKPLLSLQGPAKQLHDDREAPVLYHVIYVGMYNCLSSCVKLKFQRILEWSSLKYCLYSGEGRGEDEEDGEED